MSYIKGSDGKVCLGLKIESYNNKSRRKSKLKKMQKTDETKREKVNSIKIPSMPGTSNVISCGLHFEKACCSAMCYI